MSRDRRDQRGGHPWRGFHKEETPVRRWWNRKARRRARAAVRKGGEPERSRGTQGWLTW